MLTLPILLGIIEDQKRRVELTKYEASRTEIGLALDGAGPAHNS